MTVQQRPSSPFPRAAASAAVFRGDQILLIQRGTGALKGYWSLPGGHIEPGERAQDAARREVAEETGITADIRALVDLHEVILKSEGGALRGHYLIAVYAGLWQAGEPKAGDDAAQAGFFPWEVPDNLQLTDGARPLIRAARTLLFSRS